MQVLHAYTLTQADGTATSVVRPSDWNSGHNIVYNLSGNTAGSSQVSGSNVVFVGGNNVTLSADTANSRVAFSAANQTQQPMAFSAGGASTTANTIQFANSNGLSFGLSNGSVTASYTVPNVPAQTYQPVAFSAEGGSSTASTLNFANSNGLSFSNSNGSIIGSYTVPTQTVQPVAYSAANGSAAFSTLQFANSNGVSFSTGTQGLYATVKTDYLTTAALSNHSHGNPTLALTNLTGTTASNSAGLTLSISAAAQSAQPVAVSGSNGSFAFSTLSMGALNGLSFYTSNGSMVGSYTVPNVPAQTVQPVAVSGSNGSFAFSTLSLGNLNGVSFYTSNGSVVASYTVPSQTVQTQNMVSVLGSTGNISFANGNGITFGGNASTITASHNALTTAALSNHSHGNPTLALTNLTGTTASNSAGLTLSLSGNAAQTVQPVAYSAANGSALFSTLAFANSNGVSFSTGTQGVYATVKTDYLTTAALSDHSHGNPTLALTNLSGTTASNSAGFTLSLSAAPGGGGADGYNIVGINGNSVGSAATVQFSNSNNVSFGLNGSTVTASASFPAQTVQPVAYSGANGSALFSTLSFANSNGVSFSTGTQGLYATVQTNFLTTAALSNHSHGNPTLALTNLTGTTASNSAGLTLSLSGNAAQTVQPVAISGSNGSFVFSTLSMGNLNGVSFYTSNGSVVASYTVPSQTVQTQNMVSVLGSTGNISFANGNGITFGGNASTITASHNGLTTARASNDAIGLNTALTGNGVAWTVNSSGLSLSVPAFLTTAALSNHSHGNPTLALTNLTGTTASNSAGLTLSLSGNAAQTIQPVAISGSNGSFAFSTLSMGNLNGVSFYTSNGSVVASYTVPTQTVQPVAYSAANGSALFSTLPFANSNGVSFSSGTQGLYATVQTNYLTTAALSNHSHGNPTLALTNLTGTTASNSAGFTLSLSAAAPGGGGNTADTFSFVGNTTGTSSGTMAQSAMVISAAGALTGGWSASSIILSAPTISSLVAVGNVSLSTNGNTISISGYGAGTGYTSTTQAGSTVGVTQNTNGMSLAWPPFITTQTVQTQASGNIARTGYTSTTQAGSTVGATLNTNGLSMAYPPFITTQTVQTQASGNIAGIGTTFAGTNISASITFNSVGLNMALSGGGGGVVNQTGPNIAVAGSTITSGTVVFSNANGVTFGLNGQTLTASAAGGGGAPDRRFKEVIQGERLTTLVGLSATNVTNRAMFLPFWMEGTGLAANTARLMMSFGASSNRSLGGTFHLGLYMQNNDTQMTLLTSNSWSASSTASSQTTAWNGVAWVDFGLGGYTISSEGRYILALQVNPVSANVTWMPVSLYGADPMPVQSRIILNGTTQALSSNSQFVPFWGVYSTTSGGLPNSVGLTQINGASSQFQMQYYAALREI